MKKVILIPLMLGIVLWASTKDSNSNDLNLKVYSEQLSEVNSIQSNIEDYLTNMSAGTTVSLEIVSGDLVIEDYTDPFPEPMAIFPYTLQGIRDAASYVVTAMNSGCTTALIRKTATGFEIVMVGC